MKNLSKTLYLHVGMPKCASTTIQDVLTRHANFFAAHGRFYGISRHDHTQGQGNATALLADMRGGHSRRVREALDFFLKRESEVVLSSEMFIGLARTTQADDLIALARAKGFDCRLICFIRRQDHWIESDYKQHIKGWSSWTEDIEALIQRRTKTRVLDYHWLLENWARSLGRENMSVVALEPCQAQHYPLDRFLQFLGVGSGMAPELTPDRQNASPPTGLIEPMRFLKQALVAQGVTPPDLPQLLSRFLVAASAQLDVPQRRFLLTRERRAALLDSFAESNSALSRDYFAGAPAFSDGLVEDSHEQVPLQAEAAQVLAAWIALDPARPWLPAAVSRGPQREGGRREKPRSRRWSLSWPPFGA